MTPKEKAEQLKKRYVKKLLKGMYEISGFVIDEIAEECALLAVDEILILITAIDGTEHWQKYYEEVKQEIEKL